MEPGEQHAPGRSADRSSGVGVSETYSFLGHFVDVGREEFGVSHMTRFKVAPFIEHEVNDVGLVRCGENQREKKEGDEETHEVEKGVCLDTMGMGCVFRLLWLEE